MICLLIFNNGLQNKIEFHYFIIAKAILITTLKLPSQHFREIILSSGCMPWFLPPFLSVIKSRVKILDACLHNFCMLLFCHCVAMTTRYCHLIFKIVISIFKLSQFTRKNFFFTAPENSCVKGSRKLVDNIGNG